MPNPGLSGGAAAAAADGDGHHLFARGLSVVARLSSDVVQAAHSAHSSNVSPVVTVCTRGSTASTASGLQERVRRATIIGNPELLRGAAVDQVLASFGRLFASSAGRIEHFELSQPVLSLQYFISHNWSTGRWEKFLALALRFNLLPAVLSSWAAGLLAAWFTAAGILDGHLYVMEGDVPRSFNAAVVGHVVFAAVFLFCQDISVLLQRLGLLRCFPSKGLVFVDKVCIHQTDKELQNDGIAQLAGFLRVSRYMIVVYSDLYLRRLWTVYEVASFLTVHQDSSRILITPTAWPRYTFGLMLMLAGNHAIYHWSQGMAMQGMSRVYLLVFCFCSIILLACFVMRSWLRCVHGMADRIAQFSIAGAECSVESDRCLVQNNISNFMRHIGKVPPGAPISEALAVFDRLVREQLNGCLRASLGRHSFPFSLICAISMIGVLDAMDCTASFIVAGKPPGKVVVAFISSAINTFATMQFGTAVCSMGLRWRFDLSGVREVAYVLAVFLFFACPMSLVSMPVLVLYRVAMASEAGVANMVALALSGYCAAWIALTLWLFRPMADDIGTTEPAPEDESPEVCKVEEAEEDIEALHLEVRSKWAQRHCRVTRASL